MTTIIIILLIVSISLLIFVLWLHFTDNRNERKPFSGNDSTMVKLIKLPDIMGTSKGHSPTRSDDKRQEKKSIISSPIFAPESKKEEVPPDPDSNPNLSSESFEEIDPLEEKKGLSTEEQENINSMFSDAVVIDSGNVLEKDLKRLSLTLSDDMLPGEGEKAAISGTVERLEGTEILNNMLQTFRSTKGFFLVEELRKAIREKENEKQTGESINKESSKTKSLQYEEINLDEYM
ncbi:hypothetical protein [Petrimonas sp.]|uniref:hypothetical protein n=1 Tax=Petrimonas sp. TaxID=2023866 RepID=UPI003F50DC60